MKLYAAGPQYLLPNVAEHTAWQQSVCEQHGHTLLSPSDKDIDFSLPPQQLSAAIYKSNIELIKQADVVIADCNPWRGTCMDDGAAYELGFAAALGKPIYGYISTLESLTARVIEYLKLQPDADGQYVDSDGFIVGDDFGTNINLMMQDGMLASGGQLVEGDFADVVAALAENVVN